MKYLSLLFVFRIEILTLLGVVLLIIFISRKKSSSSSKFLRVAVVIILGIVIWISLSFLSVAGIVKRGPGDPAKRILSQIKLEKLSSDYKQYILTTGQSPDSLKVLVDCVGAAKGCFSITQPKDLLDGWDNQIQLKCPSSNNATECELISYGADNEVGGVEENADIIKKIAS